MEHEWVQDAGNGQYTVGLTDFAQGHLGDLVLVQLPEVGSVFAVGDEAAVVESVKAVSEVMAPLSGTVTEVNEALADGPEAVNEDPYGAGWMFRFSASAPAQFGSLMSAAAYSAMIAGQA